MDKQEYTPAAGQTGPEDTENCSHDCSSCGANCPSKGAAAQDFQIALNDLSNVKKVIGVVSGKGGVGKSLVSAMMAVSMQRRGLQAAVLDADVTGPSVPRMFGIEKRVEATDLGMLPAKSKTGIDIMSANLLLEDTSAPIVWRGPMIANLVQQFWSETVWRNVDFMFVDMPPGTGDVSLTVFQSLPVDGIIIVTSPQDLVSMIVEKAVRMAQMMEVPIIGLVENMSYMQCPDCDKILKPFGESHVDGIAAQHGLQVLAKLPINPEFAKLCDNGMVELFEGDFLESAADTVEAFA